MTTYIEKVAVCMFSHATGKADLYLLNHKKTDRRSLFKSQTSKALRP